VVVKVTSNVAWTLALDGTKVTEGAEAVTDFEVTVPVVANTATEVANHTLLLSDVPAEGAQAVTATAQFTQAAAQPEEPEVPVVPEAPTIDEFLKAEVDATVWYTLTGKITNIANTTYGNFDLTDETGTVYVYGLTKTQVEKNDKSFSELGLRVGDVVTLKGTRAEYNGSAQVGGPAYYVSHVAAPYLTVPASATVDATATTYSINVEANVEWTATASAGATLDVTSGNGNGSVTMTFAANTTSEPVTYTVTFAGEGLTKTFTLTQKAVPAADADPRYVKVTAEQQDWSGKYLIVWGSKAHATLSGKDLNATADVTIVADEIAATAELEQAVMTVTKDGDHYVMTFADGKYFGMQHNGCKLMTDAFSLGFAYSDAGVKISGQAVNDGKTNTYYLYENVGTSGTYYRCYVDKNGQKGYTFPTLYKYTE
jgi:hypothetical protein